MNSDRVSTHHMLTYCFCPLFLEVMSHSTQWKIPSSKDRNRSSQTGCVVHGHFELRLKYKNPYQIPEISQSEIQVFCSALLSFSAFLLFVTFSLSVTDRQAQQLWNCALTDWIKSQQLRISSRIMQATYKYKTQHKNLQVSSKQF